MTQEEFAGNLQKLDQKILRWSSSSSSAPEEFLEAELRREINRILMRNQSFSH